MNRQRKEVKDMNWTRTKTTAALNILMWICLIAATLLQKNVILYAGLVTIAATIAGGFIRSVVGGVWIGIAILGILSLLYVIDPYINPAGYPPVAVVIVGLLTGALMVAKKKKV